MKHLFNVILLLIPYLASSEGVKFDFVSHDQVSVLNTNNFSSYVLVNDNGINLFDRILYPGESQTFNYQYSNKSSKTLQFTSLYSDDAWKRDIARVKRAKEIRDKKRQEWGVIKAIGVFIDEYFFDGAISTLFEIGNYGVMLFNGASEEEWSAALSRSAINISINSLDSKSQKTIASTAFSLAESMQEREYADLQEWLAYFMRLRQESHPQIGRIIDTAKLPIRVPVEFPHIAISGSYPFAQKYTEDPFDEDLKASSIKVNDLKQQIPIDFRVAMQTGPSVGIFLEYSKSGIVLNTTKPEIEYIKLGNSFIHTTYSVGINPSINYVELGFGASYIDQENFTNNGIEANMTPINKTNKWAGFVEPRINIKIAKPITVFGSWRSTMFIDEIAKRKLISISNFKAGLTFRFKARKLSFKN